MATMAEGAARAETFWQRMAIGLALVIIFGFLQFALRGLADPVAAPLWVHAHGVLMLAWLGLLIAQPTLVSRGNLALHRRLGWIGAGLAVVIVGVTLYTAVASLEMRRFPPFFAPPYFLVLTSVEGLAFGAVVAWAARRRDTQWHRRLMIGATIILLEPALGRILPMPLMIGWSDLPIGLIQLGVVGVIARHDRRTLGGIHRATRAVAVIVIAVRATIYLLPMAPPIAAFAERLAGG